MKIKDRLHRSYSTISVIVLLLTGGIIFLTTQGSISRKLDMELSQTNLLVYKMVENVFDINRNILLHNLNILEKYVKNVSLDENDLINSDAEHYITQLTDYIRIKKLMINGDAVLEDTGLVDRVADITGGNVSILQLFPHGLLRVSTNILRTDGSRATQIYYPNDTEITRTIRSGEVYIGKTFEMGEWYLVAYKPLFLNGTVLGALQVGIKPDINTLRKHILEIRIGRTGIPFIVDTEGILVLSADHENENVYHLPSIKAMIKGGGKGSLIYSEKRPNRIGKRKIIVAYQTLSDMGWIVASGSYLDEFYGDLGVISWIIIVSIISALGIIIFVSFNLAENLSKPIKLLTACMSDVREMKYDFSNFSMIDQVRDQIGSIEIREEEIQVLASTFSTMLKELEDAHRQQISKHRQYRESELIKKVDEILFPDYEQLQDQDVSLGGVSREDAGGGLFDQSAGPNGQIWYLIGTTREQNGLAGIFMMMAQSSLNSILKEIPDASPIEVARMLNGYLAYEINERIGKKDPFQISIIVSSASGWIQYAGPQSDLRLYRHSAAIYERIQTHRQVGNESENCIIYTSTFPIQEGQLLLLLPDFLSDSHNGHAGEISRIIHDNWYIPVEELDSLFRRNINPDSSHEGLFPFFLKRIAT